MPRDSTQASRRAIACAEHLRAGNETRSNLQSEEYGHPRGHLFWYLANTLVS